MFASRPVWLYDSAVPLCAGATGPLTLSPRPRTTRPRSPSPSLRAPSTTARSATSPLQSPTPPAVRHGRRRRSSGPPGTPRAFVRAAASWLPRTASRRSRRRRSSTGVTVNVLVCPSSSSSSSSSSSVGWMSSSWCAIGRSHMSAFSPAESSRPLSRNRMMAWSVVTPGTSTGTFRTTVDVTVCSPRSVIEGGSSVTVYAGSGLVVLDAQMLARSAAGAPGRRCRRVSPSGRSTPRRPTPRRRPPRTRAAGASGSCRSPRFVNANCMSRAVGARLRRSAP